MLYRPLGRTGVKLSVLGFGTGHLPEVEDGGHRRIDVESAVKLMHRAFALGINYVDTAYGDHGGESERIVGQALKGWRNKIYLSTKSPSYLVKKPGDFFRYLEEQLKRLEVDFIDFYHLHGIGYNSCLEIESKAGWLEEAQKAKEEGLIKHISFSLNAPPEDLKKLVDMGIFSSVLCRYNLLDRKNEEAIHYVARKGIGVLVMEPFGGGKVIGLPDKFREQISSRVQNNVEMALRFVLTNPDVTCALSGMTNLEMLEENIFYAGNPDPLPSRELEKIERLLNNLRKKADVYCTGCEYCLPCPQDVNIPYIFELYTYLRVYELEDYARKMYAKIESDPWIKGKNALACFECGLCEQKCPQMIEIRTQLKEAHRLLSPYYRGKQK